MLEAVVAASNESSTVEDAIKGAVDAVCAHTTWPVGHAFVRDRASGDLVPSTSWHIDQPNTFEAFREVTNRTTFPEGIGLPGRVLATGTAAWITDVTTDPAFARQDLGVRGAFAFPIHADGEVTAVLEFFTVPAIAPDPALLEVMAQIGRQLGRVIERIRAQEQIAHQATHDALTGLANRLLFSDRLELALAHAERRGSVAALLFLDLDGSSTSTTRSATTRGPAPAGRLDRLRVALRATDSRAFRRRGVHAGALRRRRVRRALRRALFGGRAVRVAERIQQALLDPFQPRPLRAGRHREHRHRDGRPEHRDPDGLLRDADIAMYRAKAARSGTLRGLRRGDPHPRVERAGDSSARCAARSTPTSCGCTTSRS